MSGRASLGGLSTDATAARNTTPRDLPPLPHGSILYPSGASLEQSDLAQSLRNVGFVLLSSVCAVAFVIAIFVLFTVDTSSY